MDLVGRTGFLGILFKIYQFFIIPPILTVADGITVTSNAYAQAKCGVTAFSRFSSKVVEIPNTVDTDLFTPDTGDSGRLSYDPFRILFVGGGLSRACYFKNVDVLLRACNSVNSHADGCTFH